MRVRVAVLGTLGALATVVGAVAIVAPDLLLDTGPLAGVVTAIADQGPKAVMTAWAAIIGLYALVAARSTSDVDEVAASSDAEGQFDAARTHPPEDVTADRRTTTGAGVDADVKIAVARGGRQLRSVRDLLRAQAVRAYANERGTTTATARRAVETGNWTTNRVAAAFLGDDGGPSATVRSRVRLWLAPERERRRRIDATLAEIERLRRDR